MICKLLLLFVAFTFSVSSQSPRLSRFEVHWAIFHPFAAIKIKKITNQNNSFVDIKKTMVELDSFSSGGKADAFRHVFYMSTYAQKIRVKTIRKLGIAHEKFNRHQFEKTKLEYGEIPDSLSSVMDLMNNELGFAIGCSNRGLSKEDIYSIVVSDIKKGKATIMKRNKSGKFLTCQDEIVDFSTYRKRWSIPKCLVSSDYHYKD